MLSAARDALAGLGVLAPGAPLPPFWARMSGNLVLMVHAQDALHSVKVGVRSRLDREYRGLSAAHAAMPRNVPRPLGLTACAGYQVLVCAGVPHERLAARDVGSPVFVRGIETYIDATVAHLRDAGEAPAIALGAALEEAAEAIGWRGHRAYRAELEPWLAGLPRIPQHGDLALNNIGIAGGGLVFFDWEDFGLADLPGFDLAVLLLSVHDFDAGRLRERLRAPTFEASLAHRLCDRLGVPRERFESLLPASLALFVRLKRSGGYDDASASRALAALRQWVTAP